jgi:hypothetical protein
MKKAMPFIMAASALFGTVWFIIYWSLPDIVIGGVVSLICLGIGIWSVIKNPN